MTSIDEARDHALQARREMMKVRPDGPFPALPPDITEPGPGCAHWFETAALLYSLAAQAFAAGDPLTGHTYEIWAFQHLQLGQMCESQTGLDTP